MHAVVDWPNTTANNVKIHAAMQQFAKDMGFGVCVCRAYKPLSGRVRDYHPLDCAYAGRTIKIPEPLFEAIQGYKK